MAQITQVLQQLLQGLSQLAGAWSGMLSGSPNGSPFASQPAQIGGFPGQGFPVQNQPFPYQPFQNQPFPGGGFYGGGPVQTQPGQGGYNGTSGLLGSVGAPPTPSDPQEFASYLQAQRLGGTLEGKTGIAQRDAIPGTRFGQVANSEAWQSSLARNYAYQFAAYATGADALTPQGMQKGQQAFNNMSNDARLFMQVAAVFKGNLLNGPGFYNNPGLKQLLLSHGLGDLANQPGVGETDVQSIGAITKALNSGQLTLDQVISSGTIDNLDRYHQVINYVQSGNFNNALNFYDNVQI
ncbi:MAG: hypothetical protein U0931_34600 [Vulcanimicrobiota bacterium]